MRFRGKNLFKMNFHKILCFCSLGGGVVFELHDEKFIMLLENEILHNVLKIMKRDKNEIFAI